MEQTQTLTREDTRDRELTSLDRCDSCGAKAWMRALMGDTELLFCAHHGTKNFDALSQVATYIQDDRHLLLDEEHQV